MKSRKFSLKDTDNTTSGRIAEDYPPQWNMDKVFSKSYRKYLAMEGTSADDETSGDTLEYHEAEVITKRSRPRLITINTAAAAACAVIAAALVRSLYLAPDRTEPDPDDINRIPAATQITGTQPTEASAAVTTIAGTTVVSDMTTASVSTVTKTTAPVKVTTYQDAPQTAPAETEQQVQQTQQIAETTAHSAETTTHTTVTTTQTTVPTVTTEHHDADWYGKFKVVQDSYTGTSGELMHKVTYDHNPDDVSEVKEHSPEIDGFTVDALNKKNNGLTEIMYSDEDGEFYMLSEFSYENFRMGLTADIGYSVTDAVQNGRSAVIIEQNNEVSPVCYFIWDDGCHVCMIMSDRENLDKMLYLANNYI